MRRPPTQRRIVGLALLALVLFFALECATPTALVVSVYSEVPCAARSAVVLVGGGRLQEIAQKAPSSVSTRCDADTRMGGVVLVPAEARDGTVAFALMQRRDGQPADACLDPLQASGCIVAKRQFRFQNHVSSDMRVDLRLSCLGLLCATDQTCRNGACVDARSVCGSACDETALSPIAGGEAPPPDPARPDATAPEGSTSPGLLGLAISAGTLLPAFDPRTASYGVVPSVVSLGIPFTITPTFASGVSVNVNGAPVASGVGSPAIPLNLLVPTAVDVSVVSAAGTTRYALVVPPVQEAYVKASNGRANAVFGGAIALSGTTLAVGAYAEASGARGIDGDQADTSAVSAGAVYIFTRSGTTWSQQAYIKASNPRVGANFGISLALSGDTLAVGSAWEASNATGINGDQTDTSAPTAGAVYVFTRSGATWSQQAYVKASNTRANAFFGASVALEGDTLAVSSSYESSNATGVNGDPSNTNALQAGAVYVFTRSGTTWSQQVYLKASNTRELAYFGYALAISGDTLAVGSFNDSSNATGHRRQSG